MLCQRFRSHFRALMRTGFLCVLLALAGTACTGGGSGLAFSPDHLPPGHQGTPYQATITVLQNRTPVFLMSVSSGALPRGLSLHYSRNENSAQISGTPQETGSFTFTVEALCYGTNTPGQQGQQQYSLVVQ